jgi:hypothetical protein
MPELPYTLEEGRELSTNVEETPKKRLIVNAPIDEKFRRQRYSMGNEAITR